MPELLWKAYIDFETEEGEREKARALFERLIDLSGHVKVWISYATFEAEPIPIPRAMREELDEDEDEVPMVEGDPVRARRVFERGYKDLKGKGLKLEVRCSIPCGCIDRMLTWACISSASFCSRSGRLSRRNTAPQRTWSRSRA